MFEELQKLSSSLGINHRVRFLGRREDIGTCLELSDAFIFPSLFEGHPLALVEAMLKGVPCITTKIGAMEEIVIDREHAILVNSRSAAELADAMVEVLRDVELRRRLAEAAQRMALERFDLRNTVTTWEELYLELSSG
jgi:glycosyltransferase involved in cell wall biosynthesis